MTRRTNDGWRMARAGLGALAIALAMVGCGQPAEEAAGGHLIYLTPTPIGENDFLELGRVGTEQAADSLGMTYETLEAADPESRRTHLEAAVEGDADLIVMISFEFTDLAAEFSAAHPDRQFALIDACPEEVAPEGNLYCATFREHEGAYLLGLMAGRLTETGQIGSVLALDIPFFHRWSDSFALGAHSIDTSIVDTQTFIGGDDPFADPLRAEELARELAAGGADSIFAVGSASNLGVFEAAADLDLMAYGVAVDQCSAAPGNVVDNNLKLVDSVTQTLIEAVMTGSAQPVSSFGLADGGIGVGALADEASDCLIADHPDIVAEVRTAAEAIIDGTVTVPDPMSSD